MLARSILGTCHKRHLLKIIMTPEEKAKVKKIGNWVAGILLSGFVISNVSVLIYHKVTDAPDPNQASAQVAPAPINASPQEPKALYQYADAGNVMTLLLAPCELRAIKKDIADESMLNPDIIKALSFKDDDGKTHQGCYAILSSSEEVVFTIEGDSAQRTRLDLSYFTKISIAGRLEQSILEKESKGVHEREKILPQGEANRQDVLNIFKPPEDGKVYTPQIAYSGHQIDPFKERGQSLEPVTNRDQTLQLRTEDGKKIWNLLAVTPDVACAGQNRQLAAELSRQHGIDFGSAKYAESEVFAMDKGNVRELKTVPACYIRSPEGVVQVFWIEGNATVSPEQFRSKWNVALLPN